MSPIVKSTDFKSSELTYRAKHGGTEKVKRDDLGSTGLTSASLLSVVEEPVERATAEQITAVIADRVRELREQKGWTQAKLAEEMAEAGMTRWKRATVVNLEKRGRASRAQGGSAGRDAVTVQELITLAYVLDVNPNALLLHPLAVGFAELPPFGYVPYKVAWNWLDGRAPLNTPEDDEDGWTAAEFQRKARPPDRWRINPRTKAGRELLEQAGVTVRTVQEMLERNKAREAREGDPEVVELGED